MVLSDQFKLERPDHLTGIKQIDPDIFAELASTYPDTPSKLETWERGQDVRNNNIPLLRILADVTQGLCEYVGEKTGVLPNAIGHSIRTRAVLPRMAQTFGSGSWHADGPLNTVRPIVFMAASNFTTEFLIPGSRADGDREYKKLWASRKTENLFSNDAIYEGIETELFDTTRLKPYEGVVTQGNVHRSPTNYTNNLIHRTFFLLWVDSQEWLR